MVAEWTEPGRALPSNGTAPASGPVPCASRPVCRVLRCPPFNLLASTSDPLGHSSTYAHNSLGELTTATDALGHATTFTYEEHGLPQTATDATNRTATNTYAFTDLVATTDPAGDRSSRVPDGGGRTIAATDALGNRTLVAYDPLNEPTSVTDALGGVTSYVYDGNGNQLQVTDTLNHSTSYTYNSMDRLATRTDPLTHAESWVYDANGNLTADGTGTYTWNARGELTTIAAGSTTTAAYAYDPLGRRVAKTISGSTTGFAYNGSTAIQETSGSTVTSNSIVAGTDQILSRTDSAGARSYLTDGLDSTLALVDASGAIQTSYAYTPYGATSASGAASTNAVQYSGRENDANGLYYYRARYYNPTYGRFISEDPLGLAAGSNLYRYAADDPVDQNDPSGMIVQVLGVIAAGCVGGAALSVVYDVATVVGNWFNGLFGAPTFAHRKVTLGSALGDAAAGCALGAATAGLGELVSIIRGARVPLAEDPAPVGGIPARGSIGTETHPGSGIFEASGGRAAAQRAFDQAAAGGTDVTPPGFGGPGGGHMVRLPDGSYVSIRYVSESGDPAVGFDTPTDGYWKVHYGY